MHPTSEEQQFLDDPDKKLWNVAANSNSPVQPHAQRLHLFISYAAYNATFAMWLARKLAAEGYLIWCDRLKLLGGQEWPREINNAITDQSFLMLASCPRYPSFAKTHEANGHSDLL